LFSKLGTVDTRELGFSKVEKELGYKLDILEMSKIFPEKAIPAEKAIPEVPSLPEAGFAITSLAESLKESAELTGKAPLGYRFDKIKAFSEPDFCPLTKG
jgi:hypothetical protein